MLRVPGLAAFFLACASLSFADDSRAISSVEQSAPPPATTTSDSHEVHVDQRCHILPDPASVPPGKKLHVRRDPVVCHVEGVLTSEHLERMDVGNQRHETWVKVVEQTHLLQDTTTAPLTFIVEHYVPEGWVVDSDPAPVKTDPSVAVFLVNARPGQIVRLHVGVRHTKLLKTTTIKTAQPAPGSAPSAPATAPPSSTVPATGAANPTL